MKRRKGRLVGEHEVLVEKWAIDLYPRTPPEVEKLIKMIEFQRLRAEGKL